MQKQNLVSERRLAIKTFKDFEKESYAAKLTAVKEFVRASKVLCHHRFILEDGRVVVYQYDFNVCCYQGYERLYAWSVHVARYIYGLTKGEEEDPSEIDPYLIESAFRVTAALEASDSDPKRLICDEKRYVGFRDGVVNLETGEILKPGPRFFLRHVVKGSCYGSGMQGENWAKFLNAVFGPTDQDRIQAWIRVLLAGSTEHNTVLVLTGVLNGGKRLFIEICEGLLGRGIGSYYESFHRFNLSSHRKNRWVGLRGVFLEYGPKDQRWDNVVALTDGHPLKVEKDPTAADLVPSINLLISCEQITVPAAARSLQLKLRIVESIESQGSQDTIQTCQNELCLGDVVLWALQIDLPEAVSRLKALSPLAQRVASDPIGTWLDLEVEEIPGAVTPLGGHRDLENHLHLEAAYPTCWAFCQRHGIYDHPDLSLNKFSNRVIRASQTVSKVSQNHGRTYLTNFRIKPEVQGVIDRWLKGKSEDNA